MNSMSLSENQVEELPMRPNIRISYGKPAIHRQFEIVPHIGKIGRALVDREAVAEICSAGSDYFAVFSTELGQVTYIFCEDGHGYKMGPGIMQKLFFWG